MKVVAAVLLAKLGRNENPTKDDFKNIFKSVGAEFDETKIDLFFSLGKDHDLTELITAGREKMVALSSGGAAVAMVAGPGGNKPSTAEPVAEAKKVVEEKEESNDGKGMMSLFD